MTSSGDRTQDDEGPFIVDGEFHCVGVAAVIQKRMKWENSNDASLDFFVGRLRDVAFGTFAYRIRQRGMIGVEDEQQEADEVDHVTAVLFLFYDRVKAWIIENFFCNLIKYGMNVVLFGVRLCPQAASCCEKFEVVVGIVRMA